MQDINTCTFSGRLAKDVEIRTVGTGDKAFSSAKFTLAVNRKAKKDNNGNWVSDADFVNFSATGSAADAIAKHCHKGDELFVSARFQTRLYEKEGQKLYYSDFAVNEFHFGSKAGAKPNEEPNEPVQASVETVDETLDLDLYSNDLPF